MNKLKNELIDDLNKIIGLLTTLRAVETSPQGPRHWVHPYINSISELRNSLFDGEYDCDDCHGTGAVFGSLAESLVDAEPCPACSGRGFSTKKAAIELNKLLEQSINVKSNVLVKFVEEVIAKN